MEEGPPPTASGVADAKQSQPRKVVSHRQGPDDYVLAHVNSDDLNYRSQIEVLDRSSVDVDIIFVDSRQMQSLDGVDKVLSDLEHSLQLPQNSFMRAVVSSNSGNTKDNRHRGAFLQDETRVLVRTAVAADVEWVKNRTGIDLGT